MGRAPCCDKANVKKGPWSPEEDSKLKSYIEQHGTGGNWIALPQKIGLKRCGKSCRLRWLNYLRPNIKHGGFTEEEDNIICNLYVSIGSRWSVIAAQLPGRTDNDIKNYWNTRLKKKLLGKHRKEQRARRGNNNNLSQHEPTIKGNINGDPNMAPANSSHQQPYWPEMPPVLAAPLPCLNQEPGFNDHDSLRKLLIKLGGRFSDHGYQPDLSDGVSNLQFPDGTHWTQHFYEEQANIGSSVCMNASENNQLQFAETQYCEDHQGSSFTAALLQEMVSTNNYPQRLDGLEFFCGEDIMVNDKVGSTNCGQSTNWGETSSVVYHHPLNVASNYEGVRRQMPQECPFQELRYQGSQ